MPERSGRCCAAQATSARNSLLGEWNYRVEPEGTPENIDWNRWLGSAAKRPFQSRPLLPFPQVLGLFGRHRNRPLLP